MTPKIIELKQASAVLVELPEGVKEVHLDIRTGRICWSTLIEGTMGGRTWHYLSSVYMGTNAIGILSDLTEEQFAECVPKEMYSHLKDQEAIWYEAIFIMDILQSENVYTENPYGKKPNCGCYTEYDREGCADECCKWINAQFRTIDPKRTVVLVKKED